jgi:hypothetical protein
MIIIKTAIGAISIIATWYMIYLIGRVTARYALQEDDIPEMPWIWPQVIHTLVGIMGIAIVGFGATCMVLCWAVGSGIMGAVGG